MAEAGYHLLMGAAVASLLGAGVRISSGFARDGLARALSSVVVAACAATLHALGLGVVGLGTDPWVLTAAAVATWLASRRLFSAPELPLGEELRSRWAALGPAARFALGAGMGAGLAWAAWLLSYPGFGWDGVTYHVPEIVSWVQSGRPGSIVDVLPSWPVGNYPLVNEVLLAWSGGISRSFAFMTVWPGALLAVLVAASWLGLRELEVPPVPAAIATGALACAPVLTSFQLNGPSTDLPALAWLACAAALSAAAWRRGRWELLTPALLAGALSVGTKTTTLLLTALVLGLAAYAGRGSLRRLALPLGVAAAVAAVVGGFWYLRNTVQHGSPFWPLVTAPWGDPPPPAVSLITDSFLDNPGRTLEKFGDRLYVRGVFVGSLLAFLFALLAPIVARRRAVTACAGVTLVSLLVWLNSPATGLNELPGSIGATYSTLRYLLPGLAAATLTLALAARRSGPAGHVATGALGVVLVVHLVQLFGLGYPQVPSPLTPLTGALLLGAVAALVPAALATRRIRRPAAMAAIVALGLAALLSTQAEGLVERHARIKFFDHALVRWFEGPADDGRPIWMAPYMIGVLAGDDLDRPIAAMAPDTSCRLVTERASAGWVVVSAFDLEPPFGPGAVARCVRGWEPEFLYEGQAVYGRESVALPPASR